MLWLYPWDTSWPNPNLQKLLSASQFGSKAISCDITLLSTAPWGCHWCHSPRAFCFYFRPPRGAWLCQRWDARTSRPSRWSRHAGSGRSPGTPRSQWTVWPLSVRLLCKPGCPALQCQRAIMCREHPQTCFENLNSSHLPRALPCLQLCFFCGRPSKANECCRSVRLFLWIIIIIIIIFDVICELFCFVFSYIRAY